MTRDRGPGVRIPPPLIFLAFFVAGLLTDRRWSPVSLPGGWRAGAVLLAISVALMLWGMITMTRARTSILPDRPASALVTGGPFRFTRNPLYVAMIIGYLSATVWIDVFAALLLLPFAVVVLRYGVIAREERYLERRFGDEYRAYCRQVRRWM